MTIKNKSGKWVCTYCGKLFDRSAQADECYETHDVVLVPLSRSDLKNLIQFMYLRNENALTPTLVNTLNRYNKLRPK